MIKKLIWRLLTACILAGGLLFGVMVMFARADTPVVDLVAGEEDFRVVGENMQDYLGEMTTGDINADGIPDLIVGASGYQGATGAVYVIFGSPNLSGTMDLDVENADITIYGFQAGSYTGHVVASGDLNGDGYADIVIGASYFSYYTSQTGAVFVIYGPITEPVAAPIYLNNPAWVDLAIFGQASGDRFGRAVAVGDVNADGTDDLVGGAYLADRPGAGGADSGRTYVFYGGETLSGTIVLSTTPTPADVTITGTNGSRLGRSIATGDVDGNGVDDLIIGADLALADGGTDQPGEVVLVYGSAALSSTIDLQIDNITGQGLGLRVQGVDDNDAFGFFVNSGNINGDRNPITPTIGYADVLVGAYFGSGRGIGYILYGGSEITTGVTITSGTWTVPISDCVNVATFYAANLDDRLGRSVSSGDMNADGYDDFVIGASWADHNSFDAAGEVYVFYGGTHLSGTINISPTGNTDLTVLGEREDDEAGRSTSVGDLNGDGVPDLIVGAVLAAPGDDYGRGEVYVIWGTAATAISITASADVITAGQAITFTVTASNRYSQTWDVTDYTTTYTTSFAAGGTWSQNRYTTEVASTWVVTAAHQGLTATTVITVVPDAATTLNLAPPMASIVAGDAITYTVIATDTYGNSWAATETAGYAIDPDAGGSWMDNTYTSELSGTWTVTATVGSVDAAATLTVTAGTLDYIILSPATTVITIGQVQTYTVEAFDAHANSLGDVTSSAEYTITLAAGGTWTDNVYTGEISGTWMVTATYEVQTASAMLTVTAPSLVTYTVSFHSGWNLFTLPLNPETPFTAETLLNYINAQAGGGACTEVDRWSGKWSAYYAGLPLPDFDIVPGQGYFIKCATVANWTLEARWFTSGVPVSLQSGWNLIGVPYPTGYTAQSLLNEINTEGGAGTCSEVDRWDGKWSAYYAGLPLPDFDIVPAQGYFVNCASAAAFTPGP